MDAQTLEVTLHRAFNRRLSPIFTKIHACAIELLCYHRRCGREFQENCSTHSEWRSHAPGTFHPQFRHN